MYTISDALRSTHSEDGTVLLDLERGKIFRLNTMASLVLTRLQKGQSDAQIIKEISVEFHAESDVVQRDVCELLNILEKYDLARKQSSEEANGNINKY